MSDVIIRRTRDVVAGFWDLIPETLQCLCAKGGNRTRKRVTPLAPQFRGVTRLRGFPLGFLLFRPVGIVSSCHRLPGFLGFLGSADDTKESSRV